MRKKKLLLGEKFIGLGFTMTLVFGAGLDGTDWIKSFVMTIIGITVMGIGTTVAKEADSEYV